MLSTEISGIAGHSFSRVFCVGKTAGGWRCFARIACLFLSIIMMTTLSASVSAGPGFLQQQQQFSRVSQAARDKAPDLKKRLAAHGLASDNLNILIVAYKAAARLEIHAKKKGDTTYKLFESFDVCASSGVLGPKRKKGDGQVPEGFYHIDRFNPVSNYHLSLGLNYPNAADRVRAKGTDPGGDIFIHGNCVTIGCLPMTDDKIKEIYLYAVYARDSGQARIPVYVFPFRMSAENIRKYSERYRQQPEVLRFWDKLKTGYDLFAKDGKPLVVSVDHNGDYAFGR